MIVLKRDPRDFYVILTALQCLVDSDEKSGDAYLARLDPEAREIEIDDRRRRRELLAYMESPEINADIKNSAMRESVLVQ